MSTENQRKSFARFAFHFSTCPPPPPSTSSLSLPLRCCESQQPMSIRYNSARGKRGGEKRALGCTDEREKKRGEETECVAKGEEKDEEGCQFWSAFAQGAKGRERGAGKKG